MAKKQKTSPAKAHAQAADVTQRTPWYRRVWFVLSLLGAGLYGLFANGPTLLTNAEKLPADFERVSNQLLTWYYKDRAWEGLWSATPEGYVDVGDMKLSDVDVKLRLLVERGRIGGEIATKSICRVVPMFDYLLLEGKVSGDTATITAFEFVGGERKNFFRFLAKRDGAVITVSLEEGSPEWLPAPARIGLHPSSDGEDPYKILNGTCSVEKEALMKKNRPNGLGR